VNIFFYDGYQVELDHRGITGLGNRLLFSKQVLYRDIFILCEAEQEQLFHQVHIAAVECYGPVPVQEIKYGSGIGLQESEVLTSHNTCIDGCNPALFLVMISDFGQEWRDIGKDLLQFFYGVNIDAMRCVCGVVFDVLGKDGAIQKTLVEWLPDINVAVCMEEGGSLVETGVGLCQGPQDGVVVVDLIQDGNYVGIRQCQFIYQPAGAVLVCVKLYFLIVSFEGEAAQCPAHRVKPFGYPAAGISAGLVLSVILLGRKGPKGLDYSHMGHKSGS